MLKNIKTELKEVFSRRFPFVFVANAGPRSAGSCVRGCDGSAAPTPQFGLLVAGRRAAPTH